MSERSDDVVTEEPLEMRLHAGGITKRIALTMRTPGHDLELAAGFVLGEGIVPHARAIRSIRHCDDRELSPDERGNVVTVDATATLAADALLERHFTITSACGVCGTAAIALLRARGHRTIDATTTIAPEILASLPERMRVRQRTFDATGGVHAAALFDSNGSMFVLREDVGRHNAVDKVVGWMALRGAVDPARTILVVSGRCSYEIVQKALAAGIPIVAAVSAPTSLAVALAREFDLTLAGFVRGGGWNAYAAPRRIAEPTA